MFLESRLQANFAAFYYEITDMQLDRTVPTPNGGFATVFQNAASSEGKGAEMDLTWLIGDSFRLIGNLSYLDAEFVDYLASNPIDKTTELEQLAGNALRQAPKWQWYIRGEYEVPMSNGGSVTFGAEASQKAKQFYTEFNDEVSGQEAYTLLNVNIEYMSPGGQFSVNAWGKNITDEFVVSGAFVSSTGLIVSGNNLPPATWGVTFGYSF